MSEQDKAGHCRHSRCCQCGAESGTPKHDAECPDAIVGRMIARSIGEPGRRKLLPKKDQP